MKKNLYESSLVDSRMEAYLQKIATGPKMSKDLSEAEAEDALTLILREDVSKIRSAIFLIAARMKLETLEENIGYWKAMDKTTIRDPIQLDHLLQIADPFDGFNRAPYFGFYTIPVLAAIGLPTYGHSAPSLPPKFGLTFEDILNKHYGITPQGNRRQRIQLLKQFKFGYINMQETHPLLEKLRDLRIEIVKRTMLSTMEKILMPLEAETGGNYLATSYFHRGYENSMIEVAKRSKFNLTIVGNGAEGTTLYGVHKPAKVFIESGKEKAEEVVCQISTMFSDETSSEIENNYKALKSEEYDLPKLVEWGESALKSGTGPAAPLIACQAGTLFHLSGFGLSFQEGYDAARKVLREGFCYKQLMQYIDNLF
jgi:anthranilate phosphoribosyltransferase